MPSDKPSLSSEENVSCDSDGNSSDGRSIERSTVDKKETKVCARFRPRKVNPKLRSPISKLVLNKRVQQKKGN